jgi:error-prone DNA polymerase
MSLVRRQLNDLEIRPVEQCYSLSKNVHHGFTNQKKPELTTAGIVILRQRPGTAKGFMFLTLEDETGFIQTIVPPAVYQRFSTVLYHSSLIVRGVLSGENGWAGMLVKEAWVLDNMFGGYEGRPSYSGGKDHWVTSRRANTFKKHMRIERHFELKRNL